MMAEYEVGELVACLMLMCAEHGISLAGESPTTGIYRQVNHKSVLVMVWMEKVV